MDYDLVVLIAFDGYAIGTRITDPTAIAAIEGSAKKLYVQRAARPVGTVTPPQPPAILPTDGAVLRRDSKDRLPTVADLSNFLASDPSSPLSQALEGKVDAAALLMVFAAKMADLPTELPSEPGVLWNNGGLPSIS